VEKGVVEVTNCFCVPHKEHDDQVDAEISYALDLYDLNKRVNASENVVGKFWIFTTTKRSRSKKGCILKFRLVGYRQRSDKSQFSNS
jgi:JAB1/Mov34/MPN/PAD-1 ubiquitin protease